MVSNMVIVGMVTALVAMAAAAPSAEPVVDNSSEDMKNFEDPKPLGELFKMFQRPQPVGGFNFFQPPPPVDPFYNPNSNANPNPTQRPVEDFQFFQQPQPVDDNIFNPYGVSGSWGFASSEGVRHKRDACWLGEKVCGLKCKFFGRGASQGRCLNGYCECYFAGQYPGYPNYNGR